jgi:hypothetical protein
MICDVDEMLMLVWVDDGRGVRKQGDSVSLCELADGEQ